jgi:hypothetical protein
VTPEIPELLPFVTAELEQELAQSSGKYQGVKSAGAQAQKGLVY